MDPLLLYILIVVFIATLVRSTFGFGESLIAVPLLILKIPVNTAVPLSVMISVLIAAIIVVQDRRKIHFHSAKWLIIYAILGIPIGLLLLVHGNENLVKGLLGFLIVSYSLYSLLSKNNFTLHTDNKVWLFVCGFLSGVFGGAYGLNGPPLVIYGNLRRWTAQHFRATLQAYFLPASLIGMIGYWYQGLWASEVNMYFLKTLPVVIPTIFIGRYFNRRLNDDSFLKYIFIGLLVIGVVLMGQAL